MKLNEKILKAHEIIDEKDELFYYLWASGAKPISAHIGLRKVQDIDGLLHLDIILDTDTTIDELVKNWYKISDERRKLAEVKGDDVREYFKELLRSRFESEYISGYEMTAVENGFINRPIKKMPSWANLAMDANFDLLVYLVRISKQQATEKDDCSAKPNLEPENEIVHLANNLFKGLLKNFGFADPKIEDEIQESIKIIAEKRCPWDIKDSPISKEKIRSKVRTLEDKYKNRLALILANGDTENLRNIRILFLRQGDWTTASELLKNTFPKSFRLYEKRLNARMSELVLSQDMNQIKSEIPPLADNLETAK